MKYLNKKIFFEKRNKNKGNLFCPVRCSLEEIPSKGVKKIKFKRLKIIGVKSFNRLNILKLIIIKSNVTNNQSKSRYRHHH